MRISDWSSDVCSSDLPDKDKGETLVSAETVIPVPAEWAARAKVDTARYAEMYRQSLGDPDAFWLEHGRRIDWIKPFTKVSNWSFDEADFGIKWFEDGVLNVSANCLDRHLRSEKHTSELQSLMRISYAVCCLKKKITH